MAHLDRGDMPNLEIDSSQNTLDGVYFYPRYYYRYDLKFFLMQLFVIGFLLIIALCVFLFAYKSNIVDVISSVKSQYINYYIAALLTIGGVSIISVLFSKSKEKLVSRLIIIMAIAFVTLSGFALYRLNLDGRYTREHFEAAYERVTSNEKNPNAVYFSLDSLTVELKDAKQYFVDESIKLYNIFQIKSFGLFIINFSICGVLMFLIFHTIKSNDEHKKVDKDLLILMDEEQNMRQ